MYMYIQYKEFKVWTYITGHLVTVPVVLFQNTNWIFTFKNGVMARKEKKKYKYQMIWT